MATIFSHAVAAASLGYVLPLPGVSKDYKFYTVTAICAMAPDADVLGFAFGINYADFFGHRGFSHSMTFALIFGILMTLYLREVPVRRAGLVLSSFLAAATFSHGILDAFTNGGLGVALFSPFYNGRIFFPYTPIEVSPIGRAFFSEAGVTVLASEAVWIGIPCLWVILLGFAAKRFWPQTQP